jgi:regulatory protein
MDARRTRKARPPLDERSLGELALAYVGRFATTRAKLRDYLARKVRERGWSGDGQPDFAAIAERFAQLGYIDDAGFAIIKGRSLTARGYGKRRLVEKLRGAGVEEQDAAAAHDHSDKEAVASALRFAERRRIGPFGDGGPVDPKQREKAIAAMVRAGHSFGLARKIAAMPAGADVVADELGDGARLNDC